MARMKKTYFVYLSLLVFIAAVTQCNSRGNKGVAQGRDLHHPLIDSFNSLTREQQVKTCGACHRQEYENEMKGPHANSYKNLQAHFALTASGRLKCPEYETYSKKMANEPLSETNTSLMCVTCHALPNMYQTMLFEPNRNADSLKVFLEELHLPPAARTGSLASLNTGDDCLTCHYNGTNVVTNAGFTQTKTTTCPPYCSPVGSALFSSNNNCIVCHKEEVADMVKLPGMATPETNCLKCHQQYDEKGKGTHYIYWQFDSADKPKPDRLIVFDDITARYDAAHKWVLIERKNTRVPHPLTKCTETAALFEVTNKQGKILGKGELRLNRREEHYQVLQPYWGDKPVPGKNGFSIPLDGTVLHDTIPNINATGAASLHLKITGIKKEQYWLPDSTGLVNYSKVIPL